MSKHVSTPQMRAIAACVRANVPVLIWGDPGVGKTATIESYGKEWGRHVETVVGSVREATDYLGLPIEDDGKVVYSPPAWAVALSEAKSGMLFLDELTTASESVRKAMLRILQERYVGEHPLPETVSIVAAANPPESSVGGVDLDPPISNRMIHIDWKFSIEEWVAGLGNGFADSTAHSLNDMLGEYDPANASRMFALMSGFFRAMPGAVAPGVPENYFESPKGWASPRSWDNAMRVMSHLDANDEDARMLVLKGAVGEAMALQFMEYAFTEDLPHPADVLENPKMVDWTGTRIDRLFAVVTGVAHLALSRGDEDSWSQAVAVMTLCGEKGRADVSLPSTKQLLNAMPKGAKIPKATHEVFSDLFIKSGITKAAAA